MRELLLAIDTAGPDCAAAILDARSGDILAAVSEDIGKGHAERLMAVIDATLAKAGVALDDIGRIAVTIGPGSFTGIRVGVAAARGLALALDIPCIGVTTLEVLAAGFLAGHPGGNVVAAMDAKRNEVYTQAFSPSGHALGAPQALAPEDVAGLAASFGAALTGSFADGSERDRFDIREVARIGSRKPAATEPPAPLYLRGPDARPQTGFALARA